MPDTEMNIELNMGTVTVRVEQTENCILEICCNKLKSMNRFATFIQNQAGVTLSDDDALKIAQLIKGRFDLAPKHSLDILIASIAANARDYPYV